MVASLQKEFLMRARSLFVIGAAVTCAFALTSAQQINPSSFGDLKWRSIGPPRSGYISSPAGVVGDPTTYYAGLPEGGVWKSTNAGLTWKPIFDAVRVASVGAVAVAPSDANVVYVGTGNQSGWSFTPGKGIYKSTDAGKTWTNVGLPNSQYIGGIVIDPRTANTVVIAVQGARAGGPPAPNAAGAAAPAGERGVYRTADGGRTWTRVLGDGSAGASDVWIDFGDPQILYAALAAGTPAQPSTPDTGIFKSTDNGVTWKPIANRGLPDGARIGSFTVASGTHGRRLYATATSGGGGRGAGGGGGGGRALYRSDDGGDSWVFGTRQLASAGGKIYADPQRPDVVYLCGTAIYRSIDAGQHVAAFWGAPSGADPRFMWIDPTNYKRMMAGVDQGPAVSVDAGETWTPYYGMVNGQFYRVSTDYDFPYHVCGPQQDSGSACVASRSDFGEIRPYDWYSGGGFENGFLIADPLDKRYMYTQGWYHVLRRFDKQTSQVIVLYQPTADDRFGSAPPLAFSPQDPHILYMASQYVMASNDRGETWKKISPDLTGPEGVPPPNPDLPTSGIRAAPVPGGNIQALAPSPVTAGVIWAGTSLGRVEVTRDNGATWKNVTPPNAAPGAINIIDASHTNAGTAYVALLSRDSHPHIYRTIDFGASWQEIANGLEDGFVVRVVREDPADPNIVYAGTVAGAYVSFDKGDHWQSLQLNLPTTVISDMTIKNNDLVISTYGRGFWILDDISPLRQARAAMASTAPGAFFLKPSTVSRARWDNTQDTPMPPEMKVGDNPPEGAILDYYLPSAAKSITLTITDPAGSMIREYSSVPPPVDPTMPNVPEYWLMPPMVLPTSAGHHRVNWDLRYENPRTMNYGYSGNLLEYREYTLSWHALPGLTPRTTIVGPMVLPGSYSAKLTVDGRTLTQPITVVADPRIPVTQAGLAAQFKLQQRIVAGINATFQAINYVTDLRAAIAARVTESAGKPDAAALASAAQALDAALVPLATGPASFGTAHRDLGRRLNDQTVADAAPTASIVAGVDTPCQLIDASMEALRKAAGSQLMPLNALLGRAGLRPLPIWSPTAAPACGR
jgi:photosystem II stability/assembly factor-like uncharacterized protein